MFSASFYVRASRVLLRIALAGLSATASALTAANAPTSHVEAYAVGNVCEALDRPLTKLDPR